MKRKFISSILAALFLCGLSACSADDINNTINGAAGKAGIDLQLNVTQDQVDDVTEKGKAAVDKVKDVVTDKDVHNAAKDFVDSVVGAATENKE